MTRTLGKAVTPAVNEPSHLERVVFRGAARSDIKYECPDMALAHGESHARLNRPVVPMYPPVARVVPEEIPHRLDQIVCRCGRLFDSICEAYAHSQLEVCVEGGFCR